jgi:heme exporter protein C
MFRWFKANWMLAMAFGLLLVNSVVIFTAVKFNSIVYTIFFYHVAAAWVSYFSFAVSLVCHLIYLKQGKLERYLFGKSSVVVGVVFAAVTLVTGSLWYNATTGSYTNVFWSWSDPRQTTTLVLFLAYFSYLIYGKGAGISPRVASLLGIVLFPMVPVSYLSAIVFNSLHPLINPSPGGTGHIYWDAVKIAALLLNVLGTSLLYMDLAKRLVSIDLKRLELERVTKQRLEAD